MRAEAEWSETIPYRRGDEDGGESGRDVSRPYDRVVMRVVDEGVETGREAYRSGGGQTDTEFLYRDLRVPHIIGLN